MIKTRTENDNISVAVIGGGAAGMFAALTAAEGGANVTVYERNDSFGRKLAITGKGRCNITNDCDVSEFMKNVPTNPKFLYSALNAFTPADTIDFFESLGVPLKTERGRRVFPKSDKAGDIVSALVGKCRSAGVCFVTGKRIRKLSVSEGKINGLYCDGESVPFDAVIICTGGKSYPRTGSEGDGYELARSVGHSVTSLTPSLVPLVSDDAICREAQGLSLKNVKLKIVENSTGKNVFSENEPGEMLFAHFGLTGPLVLSASSRIDGKKLTAGEYSAVIDLKPALDEKTLDRRIQADFLRNINKDFCNSLGELLPLKLISPIIERSGIDGRKKVNSVTAEEREKLAANIKNLTVKLRGFRPIDEAIVTKGGISTKEIDPKTMMSKLISGLYFAGEVIDVDAYTGGYNLQIAFATGHAAGNAASAKQPKE